MKIKDANLIFGNSNSLSSTACSLLKFPFSTIRVRKVIVWCILLKNNQFTIIKNQYFAEIVRDGFTLFQPFPHQTCQCYVLFHYAIEN